MAFPSLPQTNITFGCCLWIINCPFFTTVIHSQQWSYSELSHLGTVVHSPPTWKISITSDRLLSPLGSVSPTSLLPALLPGNTDSWGPLHYHHHLFNDRLTGEPPAPTRADTALTATAKPLTFLPEHGLWQDVAFFLWSRQFGFFNVRPGCACLQCSHRLLRGSFLSFLKAQVPAAQGRTSSHPPTSGTRALGLQQAAYQPSVRTLRGPVATDHFTPGASQLDLNNNTAHKAVVFQTWPQSVMWCRVSVKVCLSGNCVSMCVKSFTSPHKQWAQKALWKTRFSVVPVQVLHHQDVSRTQSAMGPALREMLFPGVTGSHLQEETPVVSSSLTKQPPHFFKYCFSVYSILKHNIPSPCPQPPPKR